MWPAQWFPVKNLLSHFFSAQYCELWPVIVDTIIHKSFWDGLKFYLEGRKPWPNSLLISKHARGVQWIHRGARTQWEVLEWINRSQYIEIHKTLRGLISKNPTLFRRTASYWKNTLESLLLYYIPRRSLFALCPWANSEPLEESNIYLIFEASVKKT